MLKDSMLSAWQLQSLGRSNQLRSPMLTWSEQEPKFAGSAPGAIRMGSHDHRAAPSKSIKQSGDTDLLLVIDYFLLTT
jgi:hypothetical protein